MSLADELLDIDWDEALNTNAALEFSKRRTTAVLRVIPAGTRVRWASAEFETEGVVADMTGIERWAVVHTYGRNAAVWVRFTRHPNLHAAHREVGENFGMYIRLENLEVLP